MSKVRKALESLTSSALKQELTKRLAAETDDTPVANIAIKCGTTFLKSYAPDFWAQCFVDGFPRGDCQEKATGRKHAFYGTDWTEKLFNMADKPWLRLHKELQAVAFKFLVRRDQMNKVETLIRHNQKISRTPPLFKDCMPQT